MKQTAKTMPLSVRKSIYSRHVPLPAAKLDYQTFLSVKQNKAQLQQFPAKELLTHDASDKIILAAGVFEDTKEVSRLTSYQNACCNILLDGQS